MHADDSHNDKPGFFSKIFGHGDDVAVPAVATDPTQGAATPQSDPIFPSPSADLAQATPQASGMSDVHTLPGGTTEPLDLSASPVTPAEPAAETFELPEIKAPETPVEPTVPVVMPEEAPAQSDNEEVLFDSTQASGSMAPEPPVAEPTPETSVESAPVPIDQPDAGDTTEPVSEDAPPPPPPVEEGEAWAKEQGETSPESQAPLADAQSDVNTILSDHPDLATDDKTQPVAEETPVEPTPIVSPLEADNPTLAETNTSEAEPTPERAAAIVRLGNHIDDLEAGLQKVRDELSALKG